MWTVRMHCESVWKSCLARSRSGRRFIWFPPGKPELYAFLTLISSEAICWRNPRNTVLFLAVFCSPSPWSRCSPCITAWLVGTEGEGEWAYTVQLLWVATLACHRRSQGWEGEGTLTFLLSLPAGLQTDSEAGKRYSTEEGESLVGETYQAGEAPTVFGPRLWSLARRIWCRNGAQSQGQ